MCAKSWAERWDEVLNTCGQENYNLLLKIFEFIETDCYKFQSFRSFLDEEAEEQRAQEVLELFDER